LLEMGTQLRGSTTSSERALVGTTRRGPGLPRGLHLLPDLTPVHRPAGFPFGGASLFRAIVPPSAHLATASLLSAIGLEDEESSSRSGSCSGHAGPKGPCGGSVMSSSLPLEISVSRTPRERGCNQPAEA